MLLFVDRKYESEAQLLVNQSSGQETAMQYSELQSNVYLINTYTDIIQGDAVLTVVNESLGNHFTIGELRDAISVTQLRTHKPSISLRRWSLQSMHKT